MPSNNMGNMKYVECLECGTVHYVVTSQEADKLIAEGKLLDEFSDRNLECCANCGSSKKFLDVTEEYISEYAWSDKIPPLLLKKK